MFKAIKPAENNIFQELLVFITEDSLVSKQKYLAIPRGKPSISLSSNTLKDDSELVQLKVFSVPLSLKNKLDFSISALNAGFYFTQ